MTVVSVSESGSAIKLRCSLSACRRAFFSRRESLLFFPGSAGIGSDGQRRDHHGGAKTQRMPRAFHSRIGSAQEEISTRQEERWRETRQSMVHTKLFTEPGGTWP